MDRATSFENIYSPEFSDVLMEFSKLVNGSDSTEALAGDGIEAVHFDIPLTEGLLSGHEVVGRIAVLEKTTDNFNAYLRFYLYTESAALTGTEYSPNVLGGIHVNIWSSEHTKEHSECNCAAITGVVCIEDDGAVRFDFNHGTGAGERDIDNRKLNTMLHRLGFDFTLSQNFNNPAYWGEVSVKGMDRLTETLRQDKLFEDL